METRGLIFLFIVGLFLIPFIQAPSVNIPQPSIQTGGNYSINTNYSNDAGHLQGLTPQQVANLFVEQDPYYFSNPNGYFNSSTLDLSNRLFTNGSNADSTINLKNVNTTGNLKVNFSQDGYNYVLRTKGENYGRGGFYLDAFYPRITFNGEAGGDAGFFEYFLDGVGKFVVGVGGAGDYVFYSSTNSKNIIAVTDGSYGNLLLGSAYDSYGDDGVNGVQMAGGVHIWDTLQVGTSITTTGNITAGRTDVGTPITTDLMTGNLSIAITYDTPSGNNYAYVMESCNPQFKVWGYKVVGGNTYYSSNYLENDTVDDGSERYYTITLNWTAGNFDGYKISAYDDCQGGVYWNYYVNSTTNSYVVDDFNQFYDSVNENPLIVTPTIGYNNVSNIHGNEIVDGDLIVNGHAYGEFIGSFEGDGSGLENVVAQSSSTATYAQYLGAGGYTPSDANNKTGKWEHFGSYTMSYSSSYLGGHSGNYIVWLSENTRNIKNASELEYIRLDIAHVLPAFGTSAIFNTNIVSNDIKVYGNTTLTGDDFACLTYSNSTSSKVIRCYVKLKDEDTHYSLIGIDKYGERYTTTGGRTTDSGFTYASNQAPIVALPTPSQGNITYGTRIDYRNVNDYNFLGNITAPNICYANGTNCIIPSPTNIFDQSLNTSDNVSFNNIKANIGNFTNITIGDPINLYEQDGDLHISNDTVIEGNLTANMLSVLGKYNLSQNFSERVTYDEEEEYHTIYQDLIINGLPSYSTSNGTKYYNYYASRIIFNITPYFPSSINLNGYTSSFGYYGGINWIREDVGLVQIQPKTSGVGGIYTQGFQPYGTYNSTNWKNNTFFFDSDSRTSNIYNFLTDVRFNNSVITNTLKANSGANITFYNSTGNGYANLNAKSFNVFSPSDKAYTEDKLSILPKPTEILNKETGKLDITTTFPKEIKEISIDDLSKPIYVEHINVTCLDEKKQIGCVDNSYNELIGYEQVLENATDIGEITFNNRLLISELKQENEYLKGNITELQSQINSFQEQLNLQKDCAKLEDFKQYKECILK